MNLNNLKITATYTSKILWRSWGFRVFFLFLFCCIVFFQVVRQTDLFGGEESGLISLASFFPYMNAYLFTLLQLILIISIPGIFLFREQKIDSMEAIYYRPESNTEYVAGILLGITGAFLVMAFISLFLGGMVQVFLTDTPVNINLYLFYLGTIILPSLVFSVGLSFFVHALLRHTALGILLLFMFFSIFIFTLDDVQQGLLNPLGLTLPGTFSEITGLANITGFLVQRACYFFTGIAFGGGTIFLFNRLDNSPKSRVKVTAVSFVLLCVGGMLGVSIFLSRVKDNNARRKYLETCEKYQASPNLSVISHDLEFEQSGKDISLKSSLLIKNTGDDNVPEIIFYLNPGMSIQSVKIGEKSLPVTRENIVVRVQENLTAGQEKRLEITCQGTIDERVCYLDIPIDKYLETRSRGYLASRHGKRFVFLDDNFTLLIPEVLWYPVVIPPATFSRLFGGSKDFTRFSLRVISPGNKTVIAPGKRIQLAGESLFVNDQALPGISLCIGSFERRAINVDSTLYELYLFHGHEDILKGLETTRDSLPSIIRLARDKIESDQKAPYPFAKFTLVETPITFATFGGARGDGLGFIQPEIIFFPERGVGVWRDHTKDAEAIKRFNEEHDFPSSIAEDMRNTLSQELFLIFSQEDKFLARTGRFPLNPFDSRHVSVEANPYCIRPVFRELVVSVRSNCYPLLNTVLMNILRKGDIFMENDNSLSSYLENHSLKDAFLDKSLPTRSFSLMLQSKSVELLKLLSTRGISTERTRAFVRHFLLSRTFQNVDFADFRQAFYQKFGLDWMDLLPSWYEKQGLPAFIVKDYKREMYNLSREQREEIREQQTSYPEIPVDVSCYCDSVLVKVSVFNDSDVDGVISIEMPGQMRTFLRDHEEKGTGQEVVGKDYLVPARSGRKITVITGVECDILNTNLSLNVPREIITDVSMDEAKEGIPCRVKEIERSSFFPPPGVVVADDVDKGFSLVHPTSRGFLRRLFSREKEINYEPYMDGLFLQKGGEILPGYFIREQAYGLYKHTQAYMIQGCGARMEWVTGIVRGGNYDVYVFIPPKITLNRMIKEVEQTKDWESSVQKVELSNIKQYYTIVHEGKEDKVIAEINENTGWILLGRFYLERGTCKVILSDEGQPYQVLQGDAVKWIPIEGEPSDLTQKSIL